MGKVGEPEKILGYYAEGQDGYPFFVEVFNRYYTLNMDCWGTEEKVWGDEEDQVLIGFVVPNKNVLGGREVIDIKRLGKTRKQVREELEELIRQYYL